DRMKLPSWTLRTRSSAGSNDNVSEMVESLDTFVIEIGTVYGPAPTRNAVPGGVRMTCATPRPAVVTGGSAGGGGGTAADVGGGAAEGGWAPGGGVVGCAGGAAGGAGGTTIVPGTGELPGGASTFTPPG